MSSTPTGDSKEPTTNVTEDFRHDPSVSKMPPTEVDGAAALPPPELGGGRYVFCEVIGQGGMGQVIRVRDRTLERDLACKIVPARLKQSGELARRLVHEAHIGGQLQHPGIVPIHELGALPDGRPFFTMKLVEGSTLAQLLRERAAKARPEAAPALAAETPRLVQIFAQVCQTVAFAHSKGIIHRDLKPANIMVGAFGDVQVMDWGLAKSVGRPDDSAPYCPVPSDLPEDQATSSGYVLGTITYMPPEQAKGESEKIDRRSDVFSLGAMLFEILTSQPLYSSRGADRREQAMAGPGPSALAALAACGAQPELIELARRCLAPLPSDRPADAGEVAHAVETYLETVQQRLRAAEVQRAAAAAEAQQAQKTAKAERRARRLTAALAAAAIVIAGVAGACLWWWQHHQAAEGQAQREREAQAALRRERAQSALDAALREAAVALQQARALPDEPERAEAPLTLALAAALRAESHAGTDDADSDLRERAAQVLAEVRHADQERRFAAALDAIRLERAEVKDGLFQFGLAAPLYAKAFADHGWNLAELDGPTFAERLKDSPARERLTAAQRQWHRVARDPAEKRRLAALLAAVEAKDDALAARWRNALVTSDNQALLKLVKDTPASALSATSIQHLADDLVQRGAVDAAVALLQQGQERFPADFWIHHDLGMALRTAKPPRLDLAARHLTAAVALRPRSSGAHLNLGLTLFDAKDYDGAGRCFRAALAINDGYWQAHLNLGNVFAEKKNYPAAVAEYERAIELHANYPRAHYQLGIILRRQNKLDKAIRAFEKAIELKEDYVQAHVGLGNALKANKDVDGAVRCFRKAIDINPKYASAHFNLGNARFERREYAEAMRCYHAAIAADPNFGLAHAALGQTLLLEGQFEAALTATEKAQALIGPGDSARPLLEKQHKRCHDMLALDQKVAAVLRGEITPATPADGINYAHLCQLRKKCYAAAARLYADAFAAEPALADDMIRQHRYNAACAAACAAAGQGKDAANLSAEQRGALRQQAYDWLRADLDYWSKDSGQPADFATTRSGMLEFWIFDADLTSVRYPRALASLPAAERDRWLQFWREVAKLAH